MSDGEPEAKDGDSPSATPAQWWDDPSLPWAHQPTRADIACFSWLGVVAVYSLIMVWGRLALLAAAPHVLASLGSWSGLVMVGALARVGDPWWPLVWVLGSLGLVKFDWVYWWAGRLWGRSLIEVWSGRSERSRRLNDRAERFARRWDTWAIAVTALPVPLPRAVIFAVLGEAGTSLRKFLIVDIVTSFVAAAGYLAVGYWIGETAVAAMDTYGKYLMWASLVVLVLVIVQQVMAQRKSAD